MKNRRYVETPRPTSPTTYIYVVCLGKDDETSVAELLRSSIGKNTNFPVHHLEEVITHVAKKRVPDASRQTGLQLSKLKDKRRAASGAEIVQIIEATMSIHQISNHGVRTAFFIGTPHNPDQAANLFSMKKYNNNPVVHKLVFIGNGLEVDKHDGYESDIVKAVIRFRDTGGAIMQIDANLSTARIISLISIFAQIDLSLQKPRTNTARPAHLVPC